ncbi:hypothetical protein [Gemmatimonas sp.]|uniref:hypothetical protein n=1 Tax=Gemmatimonas sp. TaxID=1962908 RepID=UPI0035635D97
MPTSLIIGSAGTEATFEVTDLLGGIPIALIIATFATHRWIKARERRGESTPESWLNDRPRLRDVGGAVWLGIFATAFAIGMGLLLPSAADNGETVLGASRSEPITRVIRQQDEVTVTKEWLVIQRSDGTIERLRPLSSEIISLPSMTSQCEPMTLLRPGDRTPCTQQLAWVFGAPVDDFPWKNIWTVGYPILLVFLLILSAGAALGSTIQLRDALRAKPDELPAAERSS